MILFSFPSPHLLAGFPGEAALEAGGLAQHHVARELQVCNKEIKCLLKQKYCVC